MVMRSAIVATATSLVLALAVVAGASQAAASTSGVPRPDHVVIVVDENHSDAGIIGNANAPYINSLAGQGANFTAFYAETHPSQPNYLALLSGSTQGVTDDNCPYSFSTANLAAELIASGAGFTGYSEDLPSVGYTGCQSGNYVRKHNPWVDFTNVAATANQPFSAFPTDYSTLPAVSIVVPNLQDDMHDGTIAQGDTWLQTNLSGYIDWAKTHNSLFVLTFDEDDYTEGNQVPTLIVGAGVVPGSYGETLNHYNLLRTLTDAYGVAAMGAAATASPITDIWGNGATGAPFVSDTFNRTVTGGFGSADVGGTWSVVGRASYASVQPGAARYQLAVPTTQLEGYVGPVQTDAQVLATVAADTVPVGGPVYISVTGRRISASAGYFAQVLINPDGSVTVALFGRSGSATFGLSGAVRVSGLTYTAGQQLSARVQVTGTNPTTVSARVWPTASTEPTTWQVSATDSTAALQAGGAVGVTGYLSKYATNAPVTMLLSSFTASPTSATPPDQPPTAAFTTSCNNLACSFDGSGSTDPDGTISSYSWAFGDTVTGTGSVVQHSYAAAGSYQVTLTVTDNQNETGSVTHTVTVSSATTAFASDSFQRTVSNGWGSADVGGNWSIVGTASRAAVVPGTATQTLDKSSQVECYLGAVAQTDADVLVNISVDRLPVGGPVYLSVEPRRIGTGNVYIAKVLIYPNGSVTIRLSRLVSGAETLLAGPITLPGVSVQAGQALSVRTTASGTGPTALAARAWLAGTMEPATWQVTTSDATSALQRSGAVGVLGYLSANATNGPVTVSYSAFTATPTN